MRNHHEPRLRTKSRLELIVVERAVRFYRHDIHTDHAGILCTKQRPQYRIMRCRRGYCAIARTHEPAYGDIKRFGCVRCKRDSFRPRAAKQIRKLLTSLEYRHTCIERCLVHSTPHPAKRAHCARNSLHYLWRLRPCRRSVIEVNHRTPSRGKRWGCPSHSNDNPCLELFLDDNVHVCHFADRQLVFNAVMFQARAARENLDTGARKLI